MSKLLIAVLFLTLWLDVFAQSPFYRIEWGKSSAAVAEKVTDQLKIEWKLDEGSGQDIGDSSGNSNDGFLGDTTSSEASDPTWNTSPGRLTFDGSDDFAESTNDVLSGCSAFTVQIVALLDSSWPSAPADTMVGVFNGIQTNDPRTRGGRNDTLTGGWTFITEIDGSTGVQFDTTSGFDPQDDAYHLVTFRWASGSLFDIILDDFDQHENDDGNADSTASCASSSCFHMIGAVSRSRGYWDSDISYVMVYCKDLSNAEVSQNWDYLLTQDTGL